MVRTARSRCAILCICVISVAGAYPTVRWLYLRQRARALLRRGGYGPDDDKANRVHRQLWAWLSRHGSSRIGEWSDERLVDELAAIGPPAIEVLIDALPDSCDLGRGLAARALVRIVPSAVEPLVARFRESPVTLRCCCALVLGRIGDVRTVQALSSGLVDPVPEVRATAAFALGNLGDRRAAASLVAKLADPSAPVRWMAGYALGRLAEGHESAWVAPMASAMRKARGVAMWDTLMPLESPLVQAWFQQGRENVTDMDTLALALAKMGPAAVAGLIGVMNDGPTHAACAAALTLARLSDPRVFGALVSALNHEDGGVRGGAAEALGMRKDPRALSPLLAVLNDEDRLARCGAAAGLRGLRDRRAVEGLIAKLRDEDEAVCSRVAEALGWIGDPRAIGPLRDLRRKTRDSLTPGFIDSALRRLEEAAGKLTATAPVPDQGSAPRNRTGARLPR